MEALWNKALWCNLVCEEYGLKVIFIEDVPKPICHSVRSYWRLKRSATLDDPVCHATSLTEQQRGLHSANMIHRATSQKIAGEIVERMAGTSILSEQVGLLVSNCFQELHMEQQLHRQIRQYDVTSIPGTCSCIRCNSSRRKSTMPIFADFSWRQIIWRNNVRQYCYKYAPS